MSKRVLLFVVVLAGMVFGQVVFTRVDHPVYGLFSRLDARHVIRFNSEVLPLSRMEVAKLLLELDEKKHLLNPLEQEELQFLKAEFWLEINKAGSTKSNIEGSGHNTANTTTEHTELTEKDISYKLLAISDKSSNIASTVSNSLNKNPSVSSVCSVVYNDLRTCTTDYITHGSVVYNDLNTTERFWLYKYTDDQFALRVSPLAGYGVRSVAGETNTIRWPGLKFFGYGGDWFGASFEYVDFGETGSNTDRAKKFTPVTGAYVNLQSGSTFEYSDVKGSVSASWKWGSISVIKDYQRWGHGQFGQVIISTKAPSFTQIRFHANPVSWFRFNYFQGWVNSLVYDSANAFWSHPESMSPSRIVPYKDKYVVANLATFSIIDELDLSLGNAFVYGPNFRFETLIPFLYYKVMDHNTGRIAADDGNGMIFSDFKVRFPKDFLFYGSTYIDVINFRDLLNGRFDNQWLAFTLGARHFNFLIPNLDVSLEYTRVNPWNYENRNDLASYKHLGYQLGHWIGQNADQLRFQVNYSRFRGLRHFAYVEWVRKGVEADIAIAYNAKKYGTISFLQGPLRRDFRFGLETTWEPLHELKLRGYYEFSSISDEDPTRTPGYLRGTQHSFGLIASYGF
ncbi:MAG: hypothetical protein EDM75_02315 [Chlorobiota bacterium]|nr:MAG: hypothetical protein EDM75_02315 [Chlorobiota bacterium]